MTDLSFSEDYVIIGMTALLPLTSGLLVLQVNPYHALVMRGILGAIAALVYTLFGAADVALTEALVGTFLSITLYAVAVRSSLNMQLGVLEGDVSQGETSPVERPSTAAVSPEPLMSALRQRLDKCNMQLKIVTYPTTQALQSALMNKDIHASYLPAERQRRIGDESLLSVQTDEPIEGHLQIRVKRLHEIMHTHLPPTTALSYTDVTQAEMLNPSKARKIAITKEAL